MATEERQNLEFLGMQRTAFMIWGLDIGSVQRKGYIKHSWMFIFNLLCLSFSEYGFFNHVVQNIANIDLVTSELSMFNQAVLLIFKTAVILVKGDAVLKLIWELNQLAKGANSAQREKWIAENRRGELMTKVYFYVCLNAAIVVFTVPLIMLIYRYARGLGYSLNMAFEIALPFDDGSAIFDVLQYVLTFLHIRAVMGSSVAIDTLFGWYIHAVSGHFCILRIKLDEMSHKISGDDNHKEFVRDIGSFVRYHNRTLKFVEDLNYLFGEIIFAEISMSCLQICFMLYTITSNRNLEKVPFDLMGFMAVTMQLVIYCFGGEKIKNENDILCDDIYLKMPWEKMYASERKLMLLPLMQAQRQVSLIGLYFNLNRSLLLYIFKTAFSFITLLGAMKE